MDRLQQALAGSARSGRKGALLFIDLDNFKILNETAGHDVGDQLLVEVARRIAACVRNGDTVARLGGDEFVVLLEDLSENAREAAAHAKEMGEKICPRSTSPTRSPGACTTAPRASASRCSSTPVDSLDELLKQADIAMYQAKSAGRNTLRFFDPEMQGALAARTVMESDAAARRSRSSVRSALPAAGRRRWRASSAPRRCCVGAIPSAAWWRRASSYLWPRKPG